MQERYGLTKEFIEEEIENYGIKNKALKNIVLLINESGVARSDDDFETLVLECCAAWSCMTNYFTIVRGKNDLKTVVYQVLKQNIEARLDNVQDEIEDGIYVDEDERQIVSSELEGFYVEEYPQYVGKTKAYKKGYMTRK